LRFLLPALALWAGAAGAACEADAGRLPGCLNVDVERITVSGLSSGAAMAVQLGVAFSSRVQGVAAVAGPPYLCARGSVWTATTACTRLYAPWYERDIDAAALAAETRKLAAAGRIDDVAHLRRQRAWLFRGTADGVVGAKASAANAALLRMLGAAVEEAPALAAGHTQPTATPGFGPCDGTDRDFVSDCRYDAAGALLRGIGAATAAAPGSASEGRLLRFGQGAYSVGYDGAGAPPADIGLAQEGWVFVPAACERGERCRVHVALHGCRQSAEDAAAGGYAQTFWQDAGYNGWAVAARLIVLYPQVRAGEYWSDLMACGADVRCWVGAKVTVARDNPRHCWDWWGYVPGGEPLAYASRRAPQMCSIMMMVEAFAPPAARRPPAQVCGP
jgi:poly(3-hydroxybutyrate) depolymerase